MAQVTGTAHDLRHLSRAIDLAAQARGRTAPNPLVGAVVARDGRTIGEGLHLAAGEPHAERAALDACGEDPAGATLYVSLEPCAHSGRTPPCTEAILDAGIARVVIASDDPSPRGAGRGVGILRDAGVAVELAPEALAQAARLLNQPFRKHSRTGRPLVVFKSAMTIDGRVATTTGDSKWISGEASRARAHRWRAEADAVAVGIGTAIADDPELTARIESVSSQPRRVVFDAEACLPVASRLVRSAGEAPVVLICSRGASSTATQALAAAGVDVVAVVGEDERARVRGALEELGAREVQSLLLEGGPHLAGAFFDAGEIDEMRTFVAPLVAGGLEARAAIEGRGVEGIDAAPRALATDVERIDDDVLITARLKEW